VGLVEELKSGDARAAWSLASRLPFARMFEAAQGRSGLI
jgi:hypothetical protein